MPHRVYFNQPRHLIDKNLQLPVLYCEVGIFTLEDGSLF